MKIGDRVVASWGYPNIPPENCVGTVIAIDDDIVTAQMDGWVEGEAGQCSGACWSWSLLKYVIETHWRAEQGRMGPMVY